MIQVITYVLEPLKATSLKLEISRCAETTDFKIFGALPDAIVPQLSYVEVRNAHIVGSESTFGIHDFIRDGYHYKAAFKNFHAAEISLDFAAKSPQIPLLGEFTLIEFVQINLKSPLFRLFMVNRELNLEIHPIFNQEETGDKKPCILRNQDSSYTS